MPLHAATATPTPATSSTTTSTTSGTPGTAPGDGDPSPPTDPMLALAVLAAVAYYAASCWLRPFGPCRHCNGTGNRTRHLAVPTYGARTGKTCRHCKGTGLRLRAGRRAFASGRTLHDRADTSRRNP